MLPKETYLTKLLSCMMTVCNLGLVGSCSGHPQLLRSGEVKTFVESITCFIWIDYTSNWHTWFMVAITSKKVPNFLLNFATYTPCSNKLIMGWCSNSIDLVCLLIRTQISTCKKVNLREVVKRWAFESVSSVMPGRFSVGLLLLTLISGMGYVLKHFWYISKSRFTQIT